jgi:uncharacterized membrane protein
MVLMRRLVLGVLAAALMAGSLPAVAHENHQREQAEQTAPADGPAPAMTPGAVQERREQQAEAMQMERPKTFWQRLVSWVGRTHPFAVHFPIALFPVALVALALARRQGEQVELIRALIVVAGGASLVAGLLGWITGGFTLDDPDWVHRWHRAIGTGLALAGTAVALWAWRRRDSVDSRAMVATLSLITVALLVQGWLGAALTHGMRHMAF